MYDLILVHQRHR